MDYATYKDLCADPLVQASFLERASALCSAAPHDERQRWFCDSATVAGQPLSITKYLATLEVSSARWDVDEFDDETMRRFTAAAMSLHQSCAWVNVPDFVAAFQNMPGADATSVAPRVDLPQHEVTVRIAAMTARLRSSSERASDTTRPGPSHRDRMR